MPKQFRRYYWFSEVDDGGMDGGREGGGGNESLGQKLANVISRA